MRGLVDANRFPPLALLALAFLPSPPGGLALLSLAFFLLSAKGRLALGLNPAFPLGLFPALGLDPAFLLSPPLSLAFFLLGPFV